MKAAHLSEISFLTFPLICASLRLGYICNLCHI